MIAAVLTIYAGVALVLIGAVALAYYAVSALRSQERPPHRFWWKVAACAGLLLANFPLAAGIVVAAMLLVSQCLVEIHNASAASLESVRVFGGGCDETIAPIPPGKRAFRSLRFRRDGQLTLRFTTGGIAHESIIENYVTSGTGSHTVVTVAADGQTSVEHKKWD